MGRTLFGTLAVLALVFTLGCGEVSTGRTDTFDVTVTGDKADRTDLQAKEGDMISLTFTTDRDEEIHLHGYDLAFECKAGQPLTRTFKADRTGRFEFEIEASGTHLGNLTVNP